MAFVNAGIKELYFFPNDATGGLELPCISTATTPAYTGVFGAGIRQNGTFSIEHMNEIRDNKNRAFPSLVNFKAEIPTMQINDDAMVSAVIDACKFGGAAVAVVTAGVVIVSDAPDTVLSASGGIFVFDKGAGVTDNTLGIDFEILFSLTERTMKFTFERAFKFGSSDADGFHDAIITDAKTNKILHTVEKLPDIDAAKVVSGFISPSFIPSALATAYADGNLVEFSVKISSKSTKNGFNSSIVSGIEVEMTATASGVDVDALLESLDYELNSGTISLVVGDDLTLEFNKNGLTRLGMVNIEDEKREASFTYSGTYDIEYVDTSVTGTITFSSTLE